MPILSRFAFKSSILETRRGSKPKTPQGLPFSTASKPTRLFDFSKRSTQEVRPNQNLAEVYAFDPSGYIVDKLGWTPWSGTEEKPGQQQILDAYVLALRQQIERREFEAGRLTEEQLVYWKPGQVIKNRIRVEAGHTVGKTKLSSGIVNHFFDCFTPSIIYTFAPTWTQIHDLLWKEIKVDRKGKGLPGRVLDLKLDIPGADNHFAIGRATNDNGGAGTERIQGQHGEFLMFVVDEAEGVASFVYEAIDSMASGGISIVLLLANPRSRASKFHKLKRFRNVASYRISCINHPNVIAGREVVRGAVLRDYVVSMIEKHCEAVTAHDDDEYTFELPFPCFAEDGSELPPGTIFRPNSEFLFRVLGIAPANVADKTLITPGRYEAACKRNPEPGDETTLRIGVDVARFGADAGTCYVRWANRVRREAQFWQADTNIYAKELEAIALRYKGAHPQITNCEFRIDGGGGFGGGVIDKLRISDLLRRSFKVFRVIEVNFGGSPRERDAYYDLVTEMMAQAAETLKGIRIDNPPETLESDLTEREYGWRNVSGVDVKKLESKIDFRKPTRLGRSPDDGDGFILCVAPDHLFGRGGFAFGDNRYMATTGLRDGISQPAAPANKPAHTTQPSPAAPATPAIRRAQPQLSPDLQRVQNYRPR